MWRDNKCNCQRCQRHATRTVRGDAFHSRQRVIRPCLELFSVQENPRAVERVAREMVLLALPSLLLLLLLLLLLVA